MKKTKKCAMCECSFEVEVDPFLDLSFLEKYCDPCGEKVNKQVAEKIVSDFEKDKVESRKALWEEQVPDEYRETDIEHPDFDQGLLVAARKWATGNYMDRRLCLGLIGPSGCCKTRVVSQLVKQIIWDGMNVLWINASKFQWACQNQFNNKTGPEAQETLSGCEKVSMLVFDDVGSLRASEVVNTTLYKILEERTSRKRPIMWTSNETPEEMLIGKILTEKERSRTVSRLIGYSNTIELNDRLL
tara:strand:+ start:10668 stop:11399 length:732 start_codon:yes stop_codon:yes gene_type:complete